jgi:hypothetical protein
LSSFSGFFIFGELMSGIVLGCYRVGLSNGIARHGAATGPHKNLSEQRDSSFDPRCFLFALYLTDIQKDVVHVR